MICYFCKKEIAVSGRIGRQDSCPHCRFDLHICKNCGHYDTSAYNECHESQADRVLDKEKSNFCDYFGPRDGKQSEIVNDPVAEAKKKLEALFKK